MHLRLDTATTVVVLLLLAASPLIAATTARASEQHPNLVELEGVSRRSRRLLGPIDALVVDG